MIKIIKKIILPICLALFAQTAIAQNFKGYELSIDKDTILIGDQITLSVKLEQQNGLKADFPKIGDTVSQGIELVRELGIDTIKLKNKIEYQKKYIITSFDSGRYQFDMPLIINYADTAKGPDTLMSNKIQFMVNTIHVDTLTYKMFDIKPQIEYPVTFAEIYPWALIIIGIIALVLLVVFLFLRWRKNHAIFGKPKQILPPHVIAFKQLSLLKTEKLWQQGKVKAYYTKITDIIREYIGDRFSISTKEKTSDEILADIKENKIDQMYSYDKLRDMLYTSDLVKFAKYQPTAEENEETFKTAFEFVTSTQPEIITDEEETSTTNTETTQTTSTQKETTASQSNDNTSLEKPKEDEKNV